ncbi:hypothetical protein [Salmonella enterica]|uniref:hypothetical protein n=1 Tax=Salmonella enterica TaxID=28901 RepID=UPI00398C4B39
MTHKWLPQVVGVALLEFMTPDDGKSENMLSCRWGRHRYTGMRLGDDRMWPLSMPCNIAGGQDRDQAHYVPSTTGLFKTLYSDGVKSCYGSV